MIGENYLESIFTLLLGVLKGFLKAYNAFIKPFEASQGSVKIKIEANFYLINLFQMQRTWRVNGHFVDKMEKGLSLETECNIKAVNYLDIFLDLNTGT